LGVTDFEEVVVCAGFCVLEVEGADLDLASIVVFLTDFVDFFWVKIGFLEAALSAACAAGFSTFLDLARTDLTTSD